MIAEGTIEEVGPRVQARGAQVLDVKGLVVCPGFIDIHTHLREPGREDKETIATGTRAAAAGGFTAVCAMPNTDPVNDTAGITRAIVEKARAEGAVRVYPIGAITRGQKGEELAEYGDLKEAGCVAFSDDGKPVASARVMRRALEYAKAFDLAIIDHCEEPTLAEKACMNEGPVSDACSACAASRPRARPSWSSATCCWPSSPAAASTSRTSPPAASVDAVRRGKARGVRVTAEVTPHHLFLTDEAVRETGYDTNTKMNPPLRSEADREAVLAGLRDGTIDCIATDHAPHTVDDKKVEYDQRGERHRGPGDGGGALPRPAGRGRAPGAAVPRGAPLGEPGPGARPARRDARPGLAGGPHASSTSRRSARWTRRGSRAAAATRPSAAGS